MNSRDKIIKKFIQIHKLSKNNNNQFIENYCNAIIKCLIIEAKYEDIIKACGKPLYHYFQYSMPKYTKDYFDWLYNPYNPVRFAVETFDSIQEIKEEWLNNK